MKTHTSFGLKDLKMLTFESKLNKSTVSLDFIRDKKFCISCKFRKCRPHDERKITTCFGPGPHARYFLNCLWNRERERKKEKKMFYKVIKLIKRF